MVAVVGGGDDDDGAQLRIDAAPFTGMPEVNVPFEVDARAYNFFYVNARRGLWEDEEEERVDFGDEWDVEEEEDESVSVPTHLPQTPHTKQDLEWRALRSAAPTPDTAGLGKRFRFAMDGAEHNDEDSDDDIDDEMLDNTTGTIGGARAAADGEAKEESEFRKWFYEHRGENNRAWKKKRKEAKKQQRQRENRRLSRKVV